MLTGYARVSTRDQKPHLQTDALQRAGCERIFEETASGAKRERPELKAALDYVRAGDSLVVWKLDRLARSTRQLLETVAVLEQRGIGLKILTQNMDTATAGGRLIFTAFSAIAEFERELIRERTRAGLDAARSRGRTPARTLREGLERGARATGGPGDHRRGRRAATRRRPVDAVPLFARSEACRARGRTLIGAHLCWNMKSPRINVTAFKGNDQSFAPARPSWNIKARLSRRLCIENPRNRPPLLRLAPCFATKSRAFVVSNLRESPH